MKIYKAINSIQKELNETGIAKTHKNSTQGYSFRGIDDIYNSLSPLLASNGVCILPRVLTRTSSERASKQGGAIFSVVIEVEFDFVCSEDGSKHTVKTYGEAMDSGDKATNKALSAAYKYACIQTFAIPTEGENDIDASSYEVESQLAKNEESPSREPVNFGNKAPSTSSKSPEDSGINVSKFIPSEVKFVEGKGKGSGKTFCEIYREDGARFSGNELQGEMATSAKRSGKEIIVSYEKNGKFFNIIKNGIKMTPDTEIEEVPF